MANILDKKRGISILKSFEINKAYTEGIYADTPANRKLGRVGMSYSAYAAKTNGSKETKEIESPYDIPVADKLNFKSVSWTNPNTDDLKMRKVHIHKYGKKNPEISIYPKSENDYSVNIPLKGSQMRNLLVNIGKKENCELNLEFSEYDMKGWPERQLFRDKSNKLSYNSEDNFITYERIPISNFYSPMKFKFPASIFDGILEQYKK